MRDRRARLLRKIVRAMVTYTLLIVLAAITIFPLMWTISTSLKKSDRVFSFEPELVPRPVRWVNYVDAWRSQPFNRYFLNSVVVSVSVMFAQLLTSSLAGYAFARLRFAGREWLFFCYLCTLMIPAQVTMVPVFVVLKYLGWLNSYKALILPHICTVYGTFLLRQFFKTIPDDLENAAIIEGCSKLGVYWHIMLPLSKPALATLGTFVFLNSWNDFFWPLVVCSSPKMMTLPVGLANFQGMYSSDWQLLMAASVIVMMPVIVVYVFNQRFFTRGIVLTGLKG